MGQRYRNRIISSTAPTSSRTAAVGIWPLDAYDQKRGSNAWPYAYGLGFAEYLVIAGGGGGATGANNSTLNIGGAGAGGFLSSIRGETSGQNTAFLPPLAITPGVTYTVTVGGGGASAVSGSNSVFSTVTAIGGGTTGSTGGSGGGSGAAGTTGQGNAGGGNGAGGGGGAGATGSPAQSVSPYSPGRGGAGISSSVTGTAVTRAGGGGGGLNVQFGITYPAATGGAGGAGGGGNGQNRYTQATAGAANTGGGGGGGAGGFYSGANHTPLPGGAGGSGVVIIRYPQAAASTTGSPTLTYVGGMAVYVFTGSGTITF